MSSSQAEEEQLGGGVVGTAPMRRKKLERRNPRVNNFDGGLQK